MFHKISTHHSLKQLTCKNVKHMICINLCELFLNDCKSFFFSVWFYSVPYGQTCFRLGGLPLKMLQICVKTGWSCPRLYQVIRYPHVRVPLDRRYVTPDAILWTLCAICKTTRKTQTVYTTKEQPSAFEDLCMGEYCHFFLFLSIIYQFSIANRCHLAYLLYQENIASDKLNSSVSWGYRRLPIQNNFGVIINYDRSFISRNTFSNPPKS